MQFIEDNNNGIGNNNQLGPKIQKKTSRKRSKKSEVNELKEKKKIKRGEGSDAHRINERIRDFDPKHSIACKKINKKFGMGIIHEELKLIAEFLCEKLNLTLDRDAKRDNRALRKWFDENWERISPLFDRIELLDKDFNLIGS